MTESRREALLEDTKRGREGAGVSAGTRRRLEGRRWVALLACHPLTLAPQSAAGVAKRQLEGTSAEGRELAELMKET